jgi:ubiquinone/menaquinone biosynthesis C-methylase UbiE
MNPKETSIESTTDFPSVADQRRYWDQRWDKTKMPNAWSIRRGETILRFLRSLPLSHPKILDIGCGTGWFTEQLSHLGTATGIDLSETTIAIAKSRFPDITFIAGDLFETSLPVAEFDIVVAQEVIAHVYDQVALLDRIAGVLKPEGYLIITTVNKFVIERTPQPPDPSEHIKQWLDQKALKRLLLSHFRILRTTTVVPMGNQGILRLINSHKLNTIMGSLIPQRHLATFKEWAGLGCTRIVLAQKRS